MNIEFKDYGIDFANIGQDFALDSVTPRHKKVDELDEQGNPLKYANGNTRQVETDEIVGWDYHITVKDDNEFFGKSASVKVMQVKPIITNEQLRKSRNYIFVNFDNLKGVLYNGKIYFSADGVSIDNGNGE